MPVKVIIYSAARDARDHRKCTVTLEGVTSTCSVGEAVLFQNPGRNAKGVIRVDGVEEWQGPFVPNTLYVVQAPPKAGLFRKEGRLRVDFKRLDDRRTGSGGRQPGTGGRNTGSSSYSKG